MGIDYEDGIEVPRSAVRSYLPPGFFDVAPRHDGGFIDFGGAFVSSRFSADLETRARMEAYWERWRTFFGLDDMASFRKIKTEFDEFRQSDLYPGNL